MDLQLKITKIEFDKAQAVHRYYMTSKVADVVIELPKSFRKFKTGTEGKISLLTSENVVEECEKGIFLHGRVLSLQDENKKAILSFGGLIALITMKSGDLSAISEGLSVYLCITGFET